jgi:catechol 2,3-dioxygenase-like lactoylglutathione lyase family enzyme
MHPRLICTTVALGLLLAASPSYAQLFAAKDAPVAYGHHHINATDIAAHTRFFADTLGGTTMTKAGRTIVKVHNALILIREQKPTGGTKGTSVDHLGFSVPNLRATIDKVKAAGFRVVTKEEAASTWTVKDDIATMAGRDLAIAYVMGPDDLKVELVEVKGQKEPLGNHHLHFASPQDTDMQAWYIKVFGASNGAPGAPVLSAALPGENLAFNKTPGAVAGTQGRVVDHIGFEIKNLPAFLKKVEAMGIKPTNVRDVPEMGVSIGFITDPWGSYIELTEGLVNIQ